MERKREKKPVPPRGKRWRRVVAGACVSASALAYAGLSGCSTVSYPQSPQFGDDGFQNVRKPRPLGWRETGKLWWDFLVGGKPAGTVPTRSIPVQAVTRGDSPSVLIVNSRSEVEERKVKLGLETPAKVEVVEGLAEGEMVLIGSRSQFKPGQKVTTKVLARKEAE